MKRIIVLVVLLTCCETVYAGNIKGWVQQEQDDQQNVFRAQVRAMQEQAKSLERIANALEKRLKVENY